MIDVTTLTDQELDDLVLVTNSEKERRSRQALSNEIEKAKQIHDADYKAWQDAVIKMNNATHPSMKRKIEREEVNPAYHREMVSSQRLDNLRFQMGRIGFTGPWA